MELDDFKLWTGPRLTKQVCDVGVVWSDQVRGKTSNTRVRRVSDTESVSLSHFNFHLPVLFCDHENIGLVYFAALLPLSRSAGHRVSLKDT